MTTVAPAALVRTARHSSASGTPVSTDRTDARASADQRYRSAARRRAASVRIEQATPGGIPGAGRGGRRRAACSAENHTSTPHFSELPVRQASRFLGRPISAEDLRMIHLSKLYRLLRRLSLLLTLPGNKFALHCFHEIHHVDLLSAPRRNGWHGYRLGSLSLRVKRPSENNRNDFRLRSTVIAWVCLMDCDA